MNGKDLEHYEFNVDMDIPQYYKDKQKEHDEMAVLLSLFVLINLAIIIIMIVVVFIRGN